MEKGRWKGKEKSRKVVQIGNSADRKNKKREKEREGTKTKNEREKKTDRQSGRESWRQKCPYRSSIGRKLLLSEQQNGDRPIEQ